MKRFLEVNEIFTGMYENDLQEEGGGVWKIES